MSEDTQSWKRIDRTRFHPLWDELPSLTVLAALPGWGRTEWMRACRAHLAAAGIASTWLSGPDALAALTSADRPSGLFFIDDVIESRHDPLWETIASTAGEDGVRIVVSTVDTPSADVVGADARVLDESDLRFAPDEISELIEVHSIPVGTDTRDDLSVSLGGCPALVRRQLERLRARREERVWASLAFTFERSILVPLLDSGDASQSTLIGMLRRGAAFRRFSVALVAQGDGASTADDAAQFGRLDALPLGSFDVCDETGEQDFVWSTGAWTAIADLIPPPERAGQLEHALLRTAEAGRVTIRLQILLELGRVDAADALVFDQYRRFLLFTDAATQERLLADGPSVAGYPSLMLLAGELRLRMQGANRQTILDAAFSYDAFAPDPAASEFERFRRHCRRAMAAAYAGRRAAAVSHLESVADMLDHTQGSQVRTAAGESREVAARVAADLYLAFWGAIQTDRHDLALGFVRIMREFGDPADPVTQIDRLTAITEEDFAGLRSLDRDGTRPDRLEFSHAASLVLIEEGDDREALERTHPLASRARPAPTRSAPDALLILSRALVSPDRLERTPVDATVARSANFWDDGRPSTFITFAAAVAHVAAGRVHDARQLVLAHPQPDWFIRTGGALVALADDRSAEALRLLETGGDTGIPRLDVLTGVLTAAALARSGLRGAAAARLDGAWLALPAPRLHRFALRFLDATTFDVLFRALGEGAAPVLNAVLQVSEGDRRTSAEAANLLLSPVEREILALQRRGLGNAGIAATRGVSHNTIRTQIRLLYRKLGVTSRAEAVALAERLALLDEGAP